jgi:hypothetical protein
MSEGWNAPLGVALGALLGLTVGLLGWCVALWWSSHRDQRQWAVQQQLWRERSPDEEREALEEARARQRAITQEARRRLGLTEEDADA